MNALTTTTIQTPHAASHGGFVRATVGAFSRYTVALNLIGIFAVVAGLSTYIVQINGSVTAGYRLRDLQVRADALALENGNLEVAVRKARTFEGLEKDVKMLGLVLGGTPSYVDATPSVALAP